MSTPYIHPHVTATIAGVEVRVEGGDVTLSALNVPYGTARVSLPLTEDTQLDPLDPRVDTRILLNATGQGSWVGVPPVWVPAAPRVFDLGLRVRSVDHVDKSVELELATDEALLTDYAVLAPDSGARAFEGSVRAVVDYVLAKVGGHLEAGGVGMPDAPVTAAFTAVNLVTNPSFEVDATGTGISSNAGSLASVAMASPAAPAGTKALRNTVPAAGNSSWYVCRGNPGDAYAVRVEPGRTYQCSMRIVSSIGRAAYPYAVFKDTANVTVGPTIPGPSITTNNTAFQEMKMTVVAPAGAAYIWLGLQTNANTVGQFHYVDAVSIVQASEPVPYWDGTTANSSLYTYAWDGTAHASSSTRTSLVDRPPEMFVWSPGITAWDFLTPITSSVGLRLWCDERRAWRLIDPAVWVLQGFVSASGENVTDATDTITREDPDVFATGVVVRYLWRDAYGVSLTAYDSAGTPSRVAVIEYNRPYPGPGAAAAILRRRNGTGRIQETTGLADWAAAPGMTARVTLPYALEQQGRVVAVRFSLEDDGLMDLTTRTLIDIPPTSWAAATATWATAQGTWTTYTG